MITIIVFRARDGRYAYCPSDVRHWNAFDALGAFKTQAEALAAALTDPTIPKGASVKVESR